jgi:hypothetical protein
MEPAFQHGAHIRLEAADRGAEPAPFGDDVEAVPVWIWVTEITASSSA